MTATTTYEIRVDRHLDDHWADWFGDITIARVGDGACSLTARVADQAQLHGLLAHLRDLNVGLISVTRVGPSPGPVLSTELRTARLTLRAATSADADATWAYRRLPSVSEWLSDTTGDRADYRGLFTRADRLATTVIVELARTATVVGDLVLRVEDGWAEAEVSADPRGRQAELSCVLDPERSGRGYATEAAAELLRYSFHELGVRRVHARTFLANTSSWRLLERIGMRREGHAVRESRDRSGRWVDTVSYALLAEDCAPGARD